MMEGRWSDFFNSWGSSNWVHDRTPGEDLNLIGQFNWDRWNEELGITEANDYVRGLDAFVASDTLYADADERQRWDEQIARSLGREYSGADAASSAPA